LISPLDWGLGHTSRCIPLIKILLDKGHRITVACNEEQQAILEPLFNTVRFTFLEGYKIVYPVNTWMAFSMTMQSPKVISAIKKEKKWLKEYVKENPQDMIISDNRFGFFHKRIESVYITHQINIQGPSLFKPILYSVHKAYIDNFHHCWIPDTPSNELAGDLSKTKIKRFKFIGPLSRFKTELPKNTTPKYKYLAIISGPEPQRSVFQKIIEKSFINSGENCAIIGGKSFENGKKIADNVAVYSHLNPEEFYQLIGDSERVISRPGYSTIMDFSILQKPIYFVPTPGQTEQEYLAKHQKKRSGINSISQSKFVIPEDSKFALVAKSESTQKERLLKVLKSIGL